MLLRPEILHALAAALLAMGLPLALIGTLFIRRIREFNARSIAATGHVVGHRESRIKTGSTGPYTPVFFPYVQFTTRDGRVLQVQGSGERSAPRLGTPVSLLYDPLRPDEVSFTGPRGRAGVAAGMRTLGIVLVLLSACAAGIAWHARG